MSALEGYVAHDHVAGTIPLSGVIAFDVKSTIS
jgi:hypothetical protein